MAVAVTAPTYRLLDSGHIVRTAELLQRRISERFPDSGLSKLAAGLCDIARETAANAERIRRPNWRLRLLALIGVGGIVGSVVAIELLAETGAQRSFALGIKSFAEFLQTLEACLGSIVFLGAAVFFVLSLENRAKRRQTLDAIHELRSLAHIVDMHQLTKDPERIGKSWVSTASSPQVHLTLFELERYFDYCSEMLSLISKVSALYIQRFPDTVAVQAVDEMETLTTGLQRKVWQKIVLLDRIRSAS